MIIWIVDVVCDVMCGLLPGWPDGCVSVVEETERGKGGRGWRLAWAIVE